MAMEAQAEKTQGEAPDMGKWGPPVHNHSNVASAQKELRPNPNPNPKSKSLTTTVTLTVTVTRTLTLIEGMANGQGKDPCLSQSF